LRDGYVHTSLETAKYTHLWRWLSILREILGTALRNREMAGCCCGAMAMHSYGEMAMENKVELSMKKILLLSVIVVAITATIVGVGTFAYFSATQVSSPNNFFTGSIGFSVDGADPWAGNFNASLSDVKPGMTGWGNVTVQNTGQNPADLWMMITNVSTSSFGTNSAKAAETPATDIDGVIHYGVYRWTLPGVFPTAYVGPATYTVSAGSHSVSGTAAKDQWIYLGTIQPGASGAYLVNESFTMDPTVTNWAQLTNMTFTVNFYAQQSQGDPRPSAPTTELAGHGRV
jgi:predicted ribosomally synthesized peptide with SipW-like signal peptide